MRKRITQLLVGALFAITGFVVAQAAIRTDQLVITGGTAAQPAIKTSRHIVSRADLYAYATTSTDAATWSPPIIEHPSNRTFMVTHDSAALTVTLPTPTTAYKGTVWTFVNLSNTDLTISLSEKVATINNLTADSVAFSTSNQKIGGAVKCINTGSAWLCTNASSATMTVADN